MSELTPHPDSEVAAFEEALLRSLEQSVSGRIARVSTPVDIASRKRGRPQGSVKVTPKVQTAIRFDADVLAGLKATGKGWQTRVNEAMREWLNSHSPA
jgi:uncharacterized protein (DUF4415 family)